MISGRVKSDDIQTEIQAMGGTLYFKNYRRRDSSGPIENGEKYLPIGESKTMYTTSTCCRKGHKINMEDIISEEKTPPAMKAK